MSTPDRRRRLAGAVDLITRLLGQLRRAPVLAVLGCLLLAAAAWTVSLGLGLAVAGAEAIVAAYVIAYLEGARTNADT